MIKSAEYLFKEFLSAKGLSMQKFSYDNSSLDNELKEFFLTIKRKDGERYKSKSLHSLKYGIKQFIMKELGKDIGEEGNFPLSAEAFKVAIHLSKKDGRGSVNHKQPLTEGDKEKLKAVVFFILT